MNTSALPDEETNPLFNQSLEKGLAVLCSFSAQRRSMTLADVASAAGISKSSAQRMVFTLEQLGFVRKHPQTRRYQLAQCVLAHMPFGSRIPLYCTAAGGAWLSAFPYG